MAKTWPPKIYFCGLYFYYMLHIIENYHCVQFKEELMKQTWESGKKT